MSMFSTLTELLTGVQRYFGNPDWERIACTQLDALKMMMVIRANEYMAKFEMLA